MAKNNEERFPETEQPTHRLMSNLERLHGTGQEDAEHLAQVHTRLFSHLSEEGSSHERIPLTTSMSREHMIAPNENKHPRRKVIGGMRSSSMGQVAAVFFTALRVGALFLVFSHLPHGLLGSTRTPQTSLIMAGGSHSVRSIEMIDASTGWAVTEQAVLRTTDGGNHWTNVTPPYLQFSKQSVATFQGATHAWVAVPHRIDNSMRVWRSTDGGTNWQSSSLQTPFPRAILFPDALHGWLLAGQHGQVDVAAETIRVYRTADGGNTWVDLPTAAALAASTAAPPAGHLPYSGQKSGMYFLNTSTGWVSGTVMTPGLSWLYVTHDGGATWRRQTLSLPAGAPSTQLVIQSPTFFNAQDGLLPVVFVGIGIDLYVTHDSGTAWQPTSLLHTTQATTTFVDMLHGWVSDGSKLFVTSDGGQHWIQRAPNNTFRNIVALTFVSSTLGWALSSQKEGTFSVLKTQDGGLTWSLLAPLGKP